MKMRVLQWFVRHRRRHFGVMVLPERLMRTWRRNVFGFLIGIGLLTSPGCWQQPAAPPKAAPSFPGLTLKIGAIGHCDPGGRDGATQGSGSRRGEEKSQSSINRFRSSPSAKWTSCSSPPIGWVSWSTPVRWQDLQ